MHNQVKLPEDLEANRPEHDKARNDSFPTLITYVAHEQLVISDVCSTQRVGGGGQWKHVDASFIGSVGAIKAVARSDLATEWTSHRNHCEARCIYDHVGAVEALAERWKVRGIRSNDASGGPPRLTDHFDDTAVPPISNS